MDGVVLIRSLDGCMDFLDGCPLSLTPVPVRFLSFFLVLFLVTILGRSWDPAGSPKSTKNEPGSEKVRPEAAPEAIFVTFSCRCRSEPLSGSIFGGPDP